MRVIAEFVDARNRKRYFPGDGNKINPPLTEEQVARLTKAGCLAEGKEAAAKDDKGGGAGGGNAPVEYAKQTADQLRDLIKARKIDGVAKDANKGALIAALEAADKAAAEEK
jgi:hypothetical protein